MRHIGATEDAAACVHSAFRRHKSHSETTSRPSGSVPTYLAIALSTASASSGERASDGLPRSSSLT